MTGGILKAQMRALWFRSVVLVVLAAGSALGCYSGTCGAGQEVPDYTINKSCTGSMMAPSNSDLNGAVKSDCTGVSDSCVRSASCLTNPSSCLKLCAEMVAAGDSARAEVDLQIGVTAPRDGETFTLPDSRVTVDAEVFDVSVMPGSTPLTTTGGTLTLHVAQNHMSWSFSLALATSGGDTVSISSGSYALTGHPTTVCQAN
jgi:hypothetical protein